MMWSHRFVLCAVLASWFTLNGGAFVPVSAGRRSLSTERSALWRHWIPDKQDFFLQKSINTLGNSSVDEIRRTMSNGVAAACLAFTVLVASPFASHAVSGGGLDYANLDITGQDFSNGNYKGKDFTQVIAKGTNFKNSNLQGCRFYKAFLVNTDFSGADLRGASLEDTSMDGASLKDANAAGAYFSASLLDAKSLVNTDFTDAQIPIKTIPLVCEREDVKGTNPTTGADTRDSLMCP